MESSNKWKDFLLKSSIPLEYEVKKILESKGCVSNYEYTYLRKDEFEVINEFSYDIDGAYISKNNFFELMIECKYRDESTKWIFTPENYGGINEIQHYSFINPNDYFTKDYKFNRLDYAPLGPLCGKGIEIHSKGGNPKSITQAIAQLSYATADKITSGIEHQIDKLLGKTEHLFYHIPIIITTAKLYRLKDNITINQIKNCEDIELIASNEDCIIFESNIGSHLENYNLQKFADFTNTYGRKKLEKHLNSFNTDLDFVFSVIAKNYSPSAIAIIHFSNDNIGINKLFDFLNEVVTPTNKTLDREKERQKRIKEIHKKFGNFRK